MFIADFHIHSQYSRATSKNCVPELLDLWARRKGLDVIGTGDFTHPAWRAELREKLIPAEEGLYTLKPEFRQQDEALPVSAEPRFIISGEISSIYKKNGKVRKVHNLLLLPSLEAAEALARRLEAIGNLHSDGRPILGLDSRDLLEIALTVCPQTIFIPAHIWTPHFSLFGAYSGFDDIRECFEDLSGHIHALETGLSSDPPMNWRLSALDNFTLVSNSDAHSPANLAREANIFNTSLSYPHIAQALANHNSGEFHGTLEFFPEEGKYHYDGHRDCRVCQKPAETIAQNGLCPVCGGKITVGVLHRVEALADRPEGYIPDNAPHFESLVPLAEVIAASAGYSAVSIKGKKLYETLLHNLGPELFVLREAPLAELERQGGPLLAEGIRRLRAGELNIQPGYDGAYGKVKILDPAERERLLGQTHFFSDQAGCGAQLPLPQRGIPLTPPVSFAGIPLKEGDNAVDLASSGREAPDGGSLNSEQQQAVEAVDPAIAVIAGPGTGKTKTLVARIIHLIQNCGVPPARITAVTFTNKAAGELRSRLEQELKDKRAARAVTVGTFHAICLRILSKQAHGTAPTIIDEAGALALVEDALDKLGLKQNARQTLRAISLHKNGAGPAGRENMLPPGLYEAYMEQLAAYQVLDYDDILLHALAQTEDLHAPAHLLVDEFQDINPVQYRLIRQWGQNSESVFIIGDPNQSIYGFRGADAGCFKWFFADHTQARRVNLTKNYRSTPEIIRLAGAAMPPDDSGQQPALTAQRPSGARVRLITAEDAFAEADFVAKEISRMVGGLDMLESSKAAAYGQARGFADIAVLYRTNRQAEILERYLKKAGIPYTVAGRDDFLSEPPVMLTLAFLRLLLNPTDAISRYRCAKHWPESLDELLEQYAPLARREKPGRLLEKWLSETGLSGQECMEKLLCAAVLHRDTRSFVENLTLGADGDLRRSGGLKYSRDAVSLSTLHAAKGLEFSVVFLAGLTEGLLPLVGRGGASNEQEERRLFYVGLSRPQDELLILTSSAPSPFLAQLPQESLLTEPAGMRKQAPLVEQQKLFTMPQNPTART